jgi:hypothetical protein
MILKRKFQAIFSYICYSSLNFPRYFITLEFFEEMLYLAGRQRFIPDNSIATLANSYELNSVRTMLCALIKSKVDPFHMGLTCAASRLEFGTTRNRETACRIPLLNRIRDVYFERSYEC